MPGLLRRIELVFDNTGMSRESRLRHGGSRLCPLMLWESLPTWPSNVRRRLKIIWSLWAEAEAEEGGIDSVTLSTLRQPCRYEHVIDLFDAITKQLSPDGNRCAHQTPMTFSKRRFRQRRPGAMSLDHLRFVAFNTAAGKAHGFRRLRLKSHFHDVVMSPLNRMFVNISSLDILRKIFIRYLF